VTGAHPQKTASQFIHNLFLPDVVLPVCLLGFLVAVLEIYKPWLRSARVRDPKGKFTIFKF